MEKHEILVTEMLPFAVGDHQARVRTMESASTSGSSTGFQRRIAVMETHQEKLVGNLVNTFSHAIARMNHWATTGTSLMAREQVRKQKKLMHKAHPFLTNH